MEKSCFSETEVNLYKKYTKAQNHVLSKLENQLAPKLFYHSLYHTLDVLHAANRIAFFENINNHEDLILIRTAAIFHDSGFLVQYKDHEFISCEYAWDVLSNLKYTDEQIELVNKMIMATKIDANPESVFERILSDADLDYLGREDYYATSDLLKKEFFSNQVVNSESEWLKLQINFLKNHHYKTRSCIMRREYFKNQRLAELQLKLSGI